MTAFGRKRPSPALLQKKPLQKFQQASMGVIGFY